MNKENFYEICRYSCAFYKPERKSADHCNGFEKIIELIEENRIELDKILQVKIKKFRNSNNELLMEKICKPCAFYNDGCDFRAGKGNEPCGGYKILDLLIEEKILGENF